VKVALSLMGSIPCFFTKRKSMRTHVVEMNGKLFEVNDMGMYRPIGDKKEIQSMMVPVRCCRCSKVYDLCDVKSENIIHRYSDCTLYKSPCCNQTVDDREWKSSPDIIKLDKRDLVY
jgi:hypothetical protein